MINQDFKITIPQTWYLVWGTSSNFPEATWQDGEIAIFRANHSFVISPSQRFLIIGNVRLSDRRNLCRSEQDYLLSDLQLIAKVWEYWGVETFSKLVGIFGLAVWDREARILYLGRDRVGGQTLYYTTTGKTRWIAPSLRTLNPYHSQQLDLVALRDYLCCAFVPGARTLWQDVRELRPGSMVTFPAEKINFYWQLQTDFKTENSCPDEQTNSLPGHGLKLRSLLDEVIQNCLPDQEAIGIFLSGGLDSSSVVALASKFHNAPIHTYSIHFGKDCPNELEFSSLVAEKFNTNHHILEITFGQMWAKLPETMAWLDDPIGDPLTVPNLLLGNLAKESVAVILNGEGGDPCFGGPKNQPMLLNQLYGSVTEQNSLSAYLLSFQKCASDLPQLFQPNIWETVRDQPYLFSEDLDSPGDYLNNLMALNIKFKGADQILTKVNNLTTAAGLIGHSPLFDQRIVALSMQIPPEYKLSGVVEKAVLKQAIADLLPTQILHR
ncbi:MAG: asparagine synthetase B family protein, partial [Microcystaceae cyanobacterium]